MFQNIENKGKHTNYEVNITLVQKPQRLHKKETKTVSDKTAKSYQWEKDRLLSSQLSSLLEGKNEIGAITHIIPVKLQMEQTSKFKKENRKVLK